MIRTLGVIPARLESSRLEGKLLLKIGEKTILHHVWEKAKSCEDIDHVVIATDSDEIARAANSLGAECVMTSSHHSNGTSRCIEAAEKYGVAFDYLINIQGDEPFINPDQLTKVIDVLKKNEACEIATLVRPAMSDEEVCDPNAVKAIFKGDGSLIWFSRAALPYLRDSSGKEWHAANEHFIHLGLYGFKKRVISTLKSLKPSKYEELEKLEQLRWLENGIAMFAGTSEEASFGIDTEADYQAALKKYEDEN